MTDDDMRQAIAKELYTYQCRDAGEDGVPWDTLPYPDADYKLSSLEEADCVLAAITESGHSIVPTAPLSDVDREELAREICVAAEMGGEEWCYGPYGPDDDSQNAADALLAKWRVVRR